MVPKPCLAATYNINIKLQSTVPLVPWSAVCKRCWYRVHANVVDRHRCAKKHASNWLAAEKPLQTVETSLGTSHLRPQTMQFDLKINEAEASETCELRLSSSCLPRHCLGHCHCSQAQPGQGVPPVMLSYACKASALNL